MTIKGICQIKREIFVRLHLRHCRLSTWNLRHADWVFCIKSLLCKNSDVSNRLCTTLSNNLERNDIFVTGRGEESAASMDHRGTHWEMDIMPYMDINYAQRRQEGWLSPTERASVSAISLRHNLATLGESRRYVVAFTRFAGGGTCLRQESLRHILASPGYAPGTIAVNVSLHGWKEDSMLVKRIAAFTHLSLNVYEL